MHTHNHKAFPTTAKMILRVAVGLGLLLCHNVPAVSYLQDGFNYSPGILGTNAPWIKATNPITVVSGSLGYAGLAAYSPSGNSASVAPGGPAYTLRPFDVVASSGQVYCSFVIKYASVSANVYVAGLLPSNVVAPAGNTADPCDLVVISATGGFRLGIRAKGQTTTYASTVLALDRAHLVVLKHHLTTGQSRLFLNPTPGHGEPESADATSSGSVVADLDKFYLRAGSSTAGRFFADSLRVASSWAEVLPYSPVTPAAKLTFTLQPQGATMGRTLADFVIQVQNADDIDMASNNVPITVELKDGTFSSGTTTLQTDASGKATFQDMVVNPPGRYTITASASGIGAGLAPATSAEFEVGITNHISTGGLALAAFLDSLQVDRFWARGVSVNWLTGAAGGSGPNMTEGTASHCSSFAPAVAHLRGVYLLRQPDASDLNLANRQADWLRTNLASGWYLINSPVAAQHMVNTGALVVASCKEDAGSGHIAVLRPSIRSDVDVLAFGPQICQSGIHNYNDTNAVAGFGQHPEAYPSRILYYGHGLATAPAPVNSVLSSSLSNGVFRINATSIVGRPYRLQWSSNLKNWIELRTFTNSNASADFYCITPLIDTAGWPARFYRLQAL